MKLLIVEDDLDIREFIRESFKSLGYSVDATANDRQGSYLARTHQYDIIILDQALPEKTGIEICIELRGSGSSIPIIFLSVIDTPQKKIEALSKGADDYLAKPFLFEELRARVQALLRRPPQLLSQIMSVENLVVDMGKQIVTYNNQPIYLTRKEYSLLEYLMRHRGMAVSRSMILEHVWSSDSDPFSNTVESHILRLRRKLNTNSKDTIIKNIPGRGYIIDA